jgi:pimeloyl-ACP methyl ester carboxylesterase
MGMKNVLNSILSAVFFGVVGVSAFITFPARAAESDANADYLLHLPGIAGYRWVDRQMVAGLREGGYTGRLAMHDWTADHEGLEALLNQPLHEQESQRVAEALTKRYRENPERRIVITAHSGGTGIAVWALEKLPDDVKVDTVVMLASALSPDYDLTKALRHVRGKMYSFNSLTDTLVLGVGTRTFGTVDGVKCDAAGRCNFALPDGADEQQYKKLVQVPYSAAWMALGNIGDHVGPMSSRFARDILAPVVLGQPIKLVTAATERAAPAEPRASNLPAAQEPAVGEQARQPDRRVQGYRSADAARQ